MLFLERVRGEKPFHRACEHHGNAHQADIDRKPHRLRQMSKRGKEVVVYHFPIGQCSVARRVFHLMRHPHFRQLVPVKNSQLAQMAIRRDCSSSETRSFFPLRTADATRVAAAAAFLSVPGSFSTRTPSTNLGKNFTKESLTRRRRTRFRSNRYRYSSGNHHSRYWWH